MQYTSEPQPFTEGTSGISPGDSLAAMDGQVTTNDQVDPSLRRQPRLHGKTFRWADKAGRYFAPVQLGQGLRGQDVTRRLS